MKNHVYCKAAQVLLMNRNRNEEITMGYTMHVKLTSIKFYKHPFYDLSPSVLSCMCVYPYHAKTTPIPNPWVTLHKQTAHKTALNYVCIQIH